MRILFYSTSSNLYDGQAVTTTTLPSFTEQWDFLANEHKEHDFLLATQLPGMFLCDAEGNDIRKSPVKGRVQRLLIKSNKEKEIAEELASLKPNLAIAATFYVVPYDWLSIKDAMVADYLREMGIPVICHTVEAATISFDKWRTHEFLEKIGVNCAKAVYMHHELWINGGNRRDLLSNVYRDSVFHEVKKLNFPVIIKDTTGLSSFGSDVVNNYDEAVGILKSKKTTSDKIIEEMISGEQFGCEIYGQYDEERGNGCYEILPPFKFSVNQYGITSPKQSVKAGPIGLSEEEETSFKIAELKEMLFKLANEMKLDGIAQVDLVFNGEKWFVIEVNPRLSGMSTTYSSSASMPLSKMIFDRLLEKREEKSKAPSFGDFRPCLNIKFPILEREKLLELKALPYVAFVNQIENHAARQIREQGYCEVILCGKTREELRKNIEDLRTQFADFIEEGFFDKAEKMLRELAG